MNNNTNISNGYIYSGVTLASGLGARYCFQQSLKALQESNENLRTAGDLLKDVKITKPAGSFFRFVLSLGATILGIDNRVSAGKFLIGGIFTGLLAFMSLGMALYSFLKRS